MKEGLANHAARSTRNGDATTAVALPLLCHDWPDRRFRACMRRIAQNARKHARLVVYPEFTENRDLAPGELVEEAIDVAREHDVATVYSGWIIENDERQAAAVLADPAATGRSAYLYRKHSQSPRMAFHNPDWVTRFEDVYLRPQPCAGRSVGLTLCHDQTIAPLQRSLVRRGADLLVMPSFGDVVHGKWLAWLRARAIENGVPVVCTMFASERNGKGFAFAIGPRGEELPLEFVPTKRGSEGFTVRSSAETVARDDGFYLAHVPPALAEADVPRARGGLGRRTLRLVGTRRGRVEDRAKVSIGTTARSAVSLGDRTVIAVLVPGERIFRPEAVARALLRAADENRDAKKRFFVVVNAWPRLPGGRHGDVLRLVVRARALEHGCVAVLASTDDDAPIEAFGSTLYRVSRDLETDGDQVVLDLSSNRLQSGGPDWFFSARANNDFSSLRFAYEALLQSCENGSVDGGES